MVPVSATDSDLGLHYACPDCLWWMGVELRSADREPRAPAVAIRICPAYTRAMKDAKCSQSSRTDASPSQPVLEVLIEVARGSFLKRGSVGDVDFVSPLPCPFNYGSVPQYVGLEGDLLDAVVLGPRLPRGTRIQVKAWGAVAMIDRDMIDYKVICSGEPVTAEQREALLRFFRFYAKCKGLLNLWRRRPGRNACEGWFEAREAICRALPRDAAWRGPSVPF